MTLLPYALALTIPMSLLFLALLVAFGRLSADREFVAMQACGVSLYRLFRPIALVATTSCLATAYVYMVLIPVGNQTFREITFNIIASSAENEVKPRVFFEGFPNIVVYAPESCPRPVAGTVSSSQTTDRVKVPPSIWRGTAGQSSTGRQDGGTGPRGLDASYGGCQERIRRGPRRLPRPEHQSGRHVRRGKHLKGSA